MQVFQICFSPAVKMQMQRCPASLHKLMLSSRNERALLEEPPTEFLYIFQVLPMGSRFNRLNSDCGFYYHCLMSLL